MHINVNNLFTANEREDPECAANDRHNVLHRCPIPGQNLVWSKRIVLCDGWQSFREPLCNGAFHQIRFTHHSSIIDLDVMLSVVLISYEVSLRSALDQARPSRPNFKGKYINRSWYSTHLDCFDTAFPLTIFWWLLCKSRVHTHFSYLLYIERVMAYKQSGFRGNDIMVYVDTQWYIT